MLLGIELLDELVFGTLTAAWPLVRHDLGLGYAQVGLALGIPGFVGCAVDPLIGALGDTSRRRAVLLSGGVAFAASLALVSCASHFWMLLGALLLAYPASGAFVSLAQASLMDADATRRERSMAAWTLVGSFGYVLGPLIVVLATWTGAGWRGALVTLAAAAAGCVAVTRTVPLGRRESRPFRETLTGIATALRTRAVLHWLAVLEAADLLLDVFHGFLALYFVDVAGTSPALAAGAVAAWTGAGLVGDALLLPLLRRFDGIRFLRATALASLAVYPAFLLCGDIRAKLVLVAVLGVLNAGWYAVPKARLYETLPGRSGTAVAVGGLGGLVGSTVPIALGTAAAAFGLGAAMWALLAAPLALIVLLHEPRPRASG